MRNASRTPWLALVLLLSTVLGGTLNAAAPPAAEGPSGDRPFPVYLDLDKTKVEIVAARFVAEYQGTTNHYQSSQPERYRAVVVTLQVTKPAGIPLTFAVPDISLHYYYGDASDVLPCSGISGFSTERNTDRPMALLDNGYGRSSTGPATSSAKTVFVDVFFQNLEPNTNDLYVFLGRSAGNAFKTEGWGEK